MKYLFGWVKAIEQMGNHKQRILFTVTNDLSYDQRMIRIASSLTEAGYQVKLIGRKKKASTPLSAKDFQQKRLRCYFEKGKLFYLEYNIRLFFYLFWQASDAICAIDLDTILPVFLVSKLRRKIIIYDAHEYFTEVPEVVRRPRIKAFWETVANWTLPYVHHNYTVGPKLADLFAERYQQPYDLIRNLPFPRTIPTKEAISEQSEIILLYQGALNEGRGLESLLDCMQFLPARFKLCLAGEGDLSQELRKRAAALSLDSKVEFLGFVPPEQLHQITPKAHLGFNLLENSGLSYYYSLANKCFDYIQAGVPSFNMNFPEYRALNEEFQTFILVETLDPNHLAKQIETLFSNPISYKELVDNCHHAATILHWENEKNNLLDFYQNVFKT